MDPRRGDLPTFLLSWQHQVGLFRIEISELRVKQMSYDYTMNITITDVGRIKIKSIHNISQFHNQRNIFKTYIDESYFYLKLK